MKIRTVSILLLALLALGLAAKTTELPENALVTLSANTSINEAAQILEISSLKFESKKMFNQSSFGGVIGIPLNNVPWRKAIELIAMYNRLEVVEYPGYIAFANIAAPATADASPVETLASTLDVEAKQVRINAIALLADRNFLKSLGIDWSTVFDGKVSINADFLGASQVPSSLFGLGMDTDISVNGSQIELSTLLKVIESNQKGTVISKPNIVVGSGKRGYIQVGQDFSVKMLDEAGNTTDRFFSTGVIMQVQPTVVEIDGTEVVHMQVSVERSSAIPGAVTTIINKSKSESELVLYDGEEAVMGGLYDTDTIRTRSGIPILKDLPWWVLGIRYLTGYYKDEIKERELVIFLRTDIVDNAFERAAQAAKVPPTPIIPPELGDWGYIEE